MRGQYRLVPVLLNARRAQAGKSVFVDRRLPGKELFCGQLVTLACFVETEQSAADGRHHFGLAPDNPTPCVCWREVSDGKRTAVRPNHILDARSNQIGDRTLYTTTNATDAMAVTLPPQL